MTTELAQEIKELARESVREAIAQEMAALRSSLLPKVSRKEQRDIEKRYGKPTRRAVYSVRVRI